MIAPTTFLCSRFLAALALACVLLPESAIPAADLTPGEVQQLSRFERATGLRDVPNFARAEMESKVQKSYQEARALFAGRGLDVARHFLAYTHVPPGNGAYFFLLEALADTDTALGLIRALWDPPKVKSGPEIKVGSRSWLLERDKSEIRVAIESVLVNDAVRSDARTAAALVEAVERLRPPPRIPGPGDAGAAVELLGRCAGPEARAALERLARDADPGIRGLAVQGLGRTAGTVVSEAKDQVSIIDTLARSLASDADSRARLEAATALGKLALPDGVSPLRKALVNERDPQVIDAIVLALEELKSPATEPNACREVAARTWEPSAGRFPFACWRAGASRDEVIGAATGGPAQLRALALYSLIEQAAARVREPLVAFAPRPIPPPPGAPPGSKPVAPFPIRSPRPPQPAQPAFDAATRDRLLVSAVEVLSRPSAAFPGKGGEISYGTTQLARDALWEISGRNMAVALAHADRISAPVTRHTMSGRYGASYYLWSKDKQAYVDYRRPKQAARAALLALAFGLLLIWGKTRRAGAVLAVSALAWSAWTLFATELRELPPPPLEFLTLTAIAFLSAGVAVALIGLVSPSGSAGPLKRLLVGAGGAAPLAAIIAFFACGMTRWNRIFPIGGEGWELIFDPIGSAIVAAIAAMALAFVDGILFRRLLPAKARGA